MLSFFSIESIFKINIQSEKLINWPQCILEVDLKFNQFCIKTQYKNITLTHYQNFITIILSLILNCTQNKKIMKFLLRNYSQFKKKLNNPSTKLDVKEHPSFCLILGYMLNKIQDFDLLYKLIQDGLKLVIQDKFPEGQFFQWLMFIYDNPKRLQDAVAFLENVQNDPDLDIIEEFSSLYSSTVYKKKPLGSKNQYNSIDTVVIGNEDQQQQRINDIPQMNQKHSEFDMNEFQKMQQDQLKKMHDDQQFARKMQQQQQKQARMFKQKMRQQQQTLCEICYVDLYDGQPAFLDKCGHGFHQNCLIESFKVQISSNNFPLKCPSADCGGQCLQRDIKFILPAQLYTKYQDHTLKQYADTHGDSVSWCPTADCGYMFFYQKDDQVRFSCLQCKKQYCLNCRCDWHKDMTCKQYKVSTTVSKQDQAFLDFVKGKKFKQCPKCKFWVQKNEGCDHMTCKCKFQFCYKCGGVYMKCECMQKARQQMQLRRQRQLAARQKREQNKRKKLQRLKQKQQKQLRQDSSPPRRGRSKKGSKK